MENLSVTQMLDEIALRLSEAGKTPDEIREFFTEQGERVADELECEMY